MIKNGMLNKWLDMQGRSIHPNNLTYKGLKFHSSSNFQVLFEHKDIYWFNGLNLVNIIIITTMLCACHFNNIILLSLSLSEISWYLVLKNGTIERLMTKCGTMVMCVLLLTNNLIYSFLCSINYLICSFNFRIWIMHANV